MNRRRRGVTTRRTKSSTSVPGFVRFERNGIRPTGASVAEATVISAADAIAGIPASLRQELLDRYNDVVNNYQRGHWEAATLNAGKFCEVVFTILQGRAQGHYPDRAQKPRDMVQACRNLESADETVMGGRALRIQIPRTIPPVYEIRNNRGTGHAGADIDPNHMDAEYALHASQWMLADLVRAYHKLEPSVARDVVTALVERTLPLVWQVGDVKRILDPAMSLQNRLLLLLYSSSGPVHETDLRAWSEYQNSHRFRNVVLAGMHRETLIHLDEATQLVHISPLGQRKVEGELLGSRVLS